MRGLEADQSRGVSWWVHSSKACDGCFSLGLAAVPEGKNNSLWIRVHVPSLLSWGGCSCSAPGVFQTQQTLGCLDCLGCWQLEMEEWEQHELPAVESSHGHGTDLPSSAQVRHTLHCDASKNNWSIPETPKQLCSLSPQKPQLRAPREVSGASMFDSTLVV